MFTMLYISKNRLPMFKRLVNLGSGGNANTVFCPQAVYVCSLEEWQRVLCDYKGVVDQKACDGMPEPDKRKVLRIYHHSRKPEK